MTLKTGEIEVNINKFEVLGYLQRTYQCQFLVTKNMLKKLDLNIDF